jgi:hypothetical protein
MVVARKWLHTEVIWHPLRARRRCGEVQWGRQRQRQRRLERRQRRNGDATEMGWDERGRKGILNTVE